MQNIFSNLTTFIPIAIILIAVVAILAIGYVKAPPDKALIISGLRKRPKILIAKAGIKFPFLERKDALIIKQISVDIKTNGYIPTLDFRLYNICWGGKSIPTLFLQKKLHLKATHCKIMLTKPF